MTAAPPTETDTSLFRAAASHRGLRVVSALDPTAWSAFVDGHPDGRIFHTPEMHRVFAAARHHQPRVWAAVDRDDRIHALLPTVSIATVSGPLRAVSTRDVAFATPLVASDRYSGEALDLLLATYRRRISAAVLFTEVRHTVDYEPQAASFERHGFRHEAHLNFLVDLTPSEEQLWAAIASSARRNVRKARSLGVMVVEATDPATIRSSYELLRETYRRIEVPLPDRSLFEAAGRILGPLGRFKVLVARLEDVPIGALTMLLHKRVAYYWYTGTLREHSACRPADLLAWHAIASARADGHRILDFGGAGRPDEPYGVRDFKAKYGGELVAFGRDVRVAAPVRLRAATTAYGLLRRFL